MCAEPQMSVVVMTRERTVYHR